MSGGASIRLTSAQLQAVEGAAEEAYPEEACGLLVGRTGSDGLCRVSTVERSANVAEPPRTRRFEVDPRLRLRLERTLRGGPDAVVGVYHSHPDGVAEPSATDLSMVFEPDLVWVITAVGGGKAGPTRAFRAKADRSAFLPVEIALAHRVGG